MPILRGDGTAAGPGSYPSAAKCRRSRSYEIVESGAICLYLTDSHPKRDIGPLPGHNNRAEYVRWLFFYAGALEPAATDSFQGWDKDKPTGFGRFEDIEAVISAQLEKTPYILGDNFSAADILIGSGVQFFKGSLFPDRKHYDDYLARLTAPAIFAPRQR